MLWLSFIHLFTMGGGGSEMQIHGKSVRLWCVGSSDRSFMVDSLSYFSFQPVFYDWCNKDRGMWDDALSASLNKAFPYFLPSVGGGGREGVPQQPRCRLNTKRGASIA